MKQPDNKINEFTGATGMAAPLGGTKSKHSKASDKTRPKKKKKKDEATTTANVGGYLGRFPGPILRNPARFDPYGIEKPVKKKKKTFIDLVAGHVIDSKNETVKKRGSTWVLYDDRTGVEIGSYRDRKTAWAKQRLKRNQDKIKRTQQQAMRKRKKKQKGKTKKESLITALAHMLLNENSLNYSFENQPIGMDNVIWDDFVNKITPETLHSDPKLKSILDEMQQSKTKVLKKAFDKLRVILEKTKHFEVLDVKGTRDPYGQPAAEFTVKMLGNNATVCLGLEIHNGRPLVCLPEETKQQLNSICNDESKLLRAELMHVQETEFDNMNDTIAVAKRRDKYLNSVMKELDKHVGGMIPMQIALLKNLLKAKYKGMK
jgi:hypothetical protein